MPARVLVFGRTTCPAHSFGGWLAVVRLLLHAEHPYGTLFGVALFAVLVLLVLFDFLILIIFEFFSRIELTC